VINLSYQTYSQLSDSLTEHFISPMYSDLISQHQLMSMNPKDKTAVKEEHP
jgi:hypothetical protein